MTNRPVYEEQVKLLVRMLPIVTEEDCFALKGGTAINLFHRNMPRLSVDIDLVFVPVLPRPESLTLIDEALDRIAASAANKIPGLVVERIPGGGNLDTRVRVSLGRATVKIEVNPNMRGLIMPTQSQAVSEAVEETFGFAEANLVAFDEVYAGKLVAALDRQHPRDLFDIMLLQEGEGLTDSLFNAFLVYLACSGRPMHELLDPNLRALSEPFEAEFEGMTAEAVALDALEQSRVWLITEIQSRLTGSAAEFLRGLHHAEPDFSLLGHESAVALPAVAWKLQHIETLMERNPRRHEEFGAMLEGLLS